MMNNTLNFEQLQAVQNINGPLLIIAGPGSGKTKTLVERTFFILKNVKNIQAENIFLSTFTENSAKELKLRIARKLQENSSNINIQQMYIGTLHSIFTRIIDENIEFSNFTSGYRILDEIEQIFFVYTNFKKFMKLEGFNSFFSAIPTLNKWECSKKMVYWLNKINEEGRRLDNIIIDNEIIIFLKNLHKYYYDLLIEYNVIDFSTIQREVYRLLFNNPNILNNLREKIKYIMVDEYQDTNPIQEKILFLLKNSDNNICVVGDDDQGIYRFRGATTKNILNFPQKFENNSCKKITLSINYRSHCDIIEFCNRWINQINWNGHRYPKNIIPSEKEFHSTKGVIRIGGDSENQWKSNLYQFISLLKSTNKIENYGQVAFLFKSLQNPKVKELKKYLIEMGLPIYSPRSKDFFEKSEIKLLIGGLLIYFPQIKSLIFEDKTYKNNYIFSYYQDCINNFTVFLRKEPKLYQWLKEKREKNKEIDLYPSFKEIIYSFLQFETFKKNITEIDYSVYNVGKFIEIIEKYEILTKITNPNDENIENYLKYFFGTYLKYLYVQKIDEYEIKDHLPENSISFLTFHQAKGLEFPVVIVGSIDNTPYEPEKNIENYIDEFLKLGSSDEPSDKKYIFDFWRVYYTAFSRAQDLLVLTTIENHHKNNYSPSYVFKSLYESSDYWNSDNFQLKKLKISRLKENDTQKLISYTGDIVPYNHCPRKYNFVKNYGLKKFRDNSTYYGVLTHKILEIINRKKLKNIDFQLIEDTATSLEKNYIHSFSDFEKEKIFNTLSLYCSSINFDNIFMIEENFYHLHQDYILLGTIDLVLKNDDTLTIIDFKTGCFDKNNFNIYKKQLEFYSYLLYQNFPNYKINGIIYFLDENCMEFPIEIDTTNWDRIIEYFLPTIENIVKDNFEVKSFDKKCLKCEFKYYCLQDKGEEN